jgi:hypothetical protein
LAVQFISTKDEIWKNRREHRRTKMQRAADFSNLGTHGFKRKATRDYGRAVAFLFSKVAFVRTAVFNNCCDRKLFFGRSCELTVDSQHRQHALYKVCHDDY